MGPTELAHRIRQRSLGRTHGILLKRRSERDASPKPFRVEFRKDGRWIDSGETFRTRFDASAFGYSRGGDKGGGYHSKYGYATQDKTWRIRGGSAWTGKPQHDASRVKGAKRREFHRLFRSTGHQFQAQGELTPSERRRAASQALRAHNYQACRKAGHKHCEHILYPGGKVPEARPWEMDPARTRRYHIVAINERTGKKSYQTSSPLTHQEAVVMLRKFSYHPKRRVQLEEVVGDAKRDPGGEFEVCVDPDGQGRRVGDAVMTTSKRAVRKASRELHFAGYTFDAGPDGTTVRRETINLDRTGDYGADPVGDGTFRMVPSGDVVDAQERDRRLGR